MPAWRQAPRKHNPLGCQFKGFCFPARHPARPASPAPTSCLACPIPLNPPSSSCSFPVVLLAIGLLGVGGAPLPLASPLYITSASSQIPLGSGKGSLFINFFSRGNNSTSCHMDFCIQLFRGLDFLPTSYPSPLDARKGGQLCFLRLGLLLVLGLRGW